MSTARRSIETKHGMDMEARSAFVVDCDVADGAQHPALLIDRDFAKRLGTSQPTVARWEAATAVSDAPVIPCPPANSGRASTASSAGSSTTTKVLRFGRPASISFRCTFRSKFKDTWPQACAGYVLVCVGFGERSKSANGTSSAVAIAE